MVMEVNKLLENEDYIIVLDTSAYLKIYKCPIEYSDFSIECLQKIKKFVYMPSMVFYEYSKHYTHEFKKMKSRVKDAVNDVNDILNSSINIVLNSCEIFRRLEFEDADKLINELKDKFDDLSDYFNKFYKTKRYPEELELVWDEDKVLKLTKDINKFPEIKFIDILRWCEEGENRYKQKTPPGYMDGKCKDGPRKYGDFIIWKEMLSFAKNNDKNIIFVTDDLKEDWWDLNKKNRTLRSELINEFEKTGKSIIGFSSNDFFDKISNCYGITKINFEMAKLDYTDKYYMESIKENVFDEISDSIFYRINDYTEIENIEHLGTEGISNCEIGDWDLISSKRIDIIDNIAKYEFIYDIRIDATTNNYWGRDDDTRDIIASPDIDLELKAIVKAEIIRDIDVIIDPKDSNEYEDVKIKEVELKELSYYDHNNDDIGYYGNCPDCGVPLYDDNYAGDGFCKDCSCKH